METEISAADFIKLCGEGDGYVYFQDRHAVNGMVEFNSQNCTFASLIIDNVLFNHQVIFSQIKLKEGLSFSRCEFSQRLTFSNCTSNPEDESKADDYISFTLRECTLHDQMVVHHFKLKVAIQIEDTTIKQQLRINNSSLCSFNVDRSSIRSMHLNVVRLSNARPSSIEDSKVIGALAMINVKSEETFLISTSEIGGHLFWTGGRTKGILLQGNTFQDSVSFAAISNKDILYIIENDFEKEMLVAFNSETQKGYHKQIFIGTNKYSTNLNIIGSDEVINLVEIVCSQDLIGSLYFKNCKLKQVKITNDNHKANIVFNQSEFGTFVLDHFINYGNLSILSCKSLVNSKSEFSIINSNIGKTQLLNFDFASFSSIQIIDSIITNIEFAGIKWFHSSVLEVGNSEEGNKKLREIYRQLKHASEKQNDRVQMLKFQAQELRLLKNEAFSDNTFSTNDKLILLLAHTNDFGLNWMKPIVWILLITWLFYISIVICTSNTLTWYPANSWSDVEYTSIELFYHKISILPQLFNPTRNLKQILSENPGFWTYTLDTLHRIILAFFIVQIVSAFRKYFKS